MKKLALLFSCTLLVFSCQKVIDVDLNESNPQTVIEGNYTAEDSTVVVRITNTSSYFNSDASQTVNNADVTITDVNGLTTNIPFVEAGIYILENYAPEFDTEYILSVQANGETFSATCEMRTPVLIDDITYEFFPSIFGADAGYAPFLNYQDPADQTDFHLITLGVNSKEWSELTDILQQDDSLVNGNYVERPLFGRSLFEFGDTVHMHFRTVDEKIYSYYGQAISNATGGGSSAPGNPDSNWDNGALGFFSAYSSSRKSVVIE
jgi:hypothetical protein